MSIETPGLINFIAPLYRPYILNLFENLNLGLCKSKIDLERAAWAAEGTESQFRLVLPYCSKKLRWEVLFDPITPWFAPDFRFDDDSFINSIEENILEKEVPSLNSWNCNDPTALGNVISELIALYKAHQIKKLSEDESSRAYFEYSALLGDSLITEKEIEVWVGGHIVEFLVRLDVDVSSLPELYNDGYEENPGIDTALLLVRYPNNTNAELILSPLLTKSLGNFTLPPMHQSGVLMDYVPMVTELINNKIRSIINNEKLKRELLAQLIVKYEGAVLEYDANNAAFLFETNNFHWILQIDIGSFPDKAPVLTLRSVYHSTKGKPKFKVLSGCPYSSFEEYVEQQVEIFKIECKGVNPSCNQYVNVES